MMTTGAEHLSAERHLLLEYPDEKIVMEVHGREKFRWYRDNRNKWFLKCPESQKSNPRARNISSWDECISHPAKWLANLIYYRDQSWHISDDFDRMQNCMNRFWHHRNVEIFHFYTSTLQEMLQSSTTPVPTVLIQHITTFLGDINVPVQFHTSVLYYNTDLELVTMDDEWALVPSIDILRQLLPENPIRGGRRQFMSTACDFTSTDIASTAGSAQQVTSFLPRLHCHICREDGHSTAFCHHRRHYRH